MRVLIDTNVILDAMLQREPWCQAAEAIVLAHANRQVDCTAATLSLASVFYVSRKVIGKAAARAAVRDYLTTFEILPVDKQMLVNADRMLGTDFEDNILIAVAVSAAVDAIITRNPADFTHSPIPVWEPAELLRRLAGAGPSANPP